jgi:hypothetical protein
MDNLRNQQIQAYWAGHQSAAFSCTNGLRQGGVASPILFSVYFDELLERLKFSGAGCHVNHTFTGAVAYADDVTLLAPSLGGLDVLLRVCDEFAQEYSVTFNSKKTVCIAFGKPDSFIADIKLHGETLKWCSEVKHLGNLLTQSLKDDSDIRMKSNDLTKQVNGILVNFRCVPRDVCNQLFSSYSHMYGSQMWDLQETRTVEKFHLTWRKCIRRLWNLPQCAHTNILHHLAKKAPLMDQLHQRFMRMYHSVQESDNNIMRYLVAVSIQEPKGVIGGNLAFCNPNRDTEQGAGKAQMIQELTRCLEGSMNLNNFNQDEIKTLIYSIAIT